MYLSFSSLDGSILASAYSFWALFNSAVCLSMVSGLPLDLNVLSTLLMGDDDLFFSEFGLGGYSSGTVRHASMKDCIRTLIRRWAGCVDVEGAYSNADVESVPGCPFISEPACIDNTRGKCLLIILTASAILPQRISWRISGGYDIVIRLRP